MISENDMMNFAMMLEKHMIMPSEWEIKVPKFVLDQLLRDGHPEVVSHHPKYGWFILGAWQGPYIAWCEMVDKLEEFVEDWLS